MPDVVVSVTALVNTGLKLLLGRDRPQWQDTTDFLETHAFPSGHASSIAAFCGVLAVLTFTFVRRRSMRHAILVALGAVWLLVCLDRVLLGRHYPTDVIAGVVLGAVWVVAAWVLLARDHPWRPDDDLVRQRRATTSS